MAKPLFEKPDKATAEANRKGCLMLLLKLFLFITGAFLLEFILGKIFGAFQEKDDFISAMQAYQNSYFSFNLYFITTQDLGNEYSFLPGAAFRFLVYLLLGYVVYGIFSVIISYIKAWKEYEDRITKTLFYTMIAACLFIAFFIPNKKTSFDREKRQMIITNYKMFVIPQSVAVSFDSIPEIRYEFTSDYDQQGREKHIFLKYYIESGNKKITLGDRDVDSYSVWSGEKKEWSPSKKILLEAEETSALLNRLVKSKL